MTTARIWIAYNNDGDFFLSTEGADEAAEEFTSQYTSGEDGMRVACIDIALPKIHSINIVVTDDDMAPIVTVS